MGGGVVHGPTGTRDGLFGIEMRAMNRARPFLLAFAAFGVVFLGVTAALRFDQWMKDRGESESIFKKHDGFLENVQYDRSGGNSADFRAAAKKILPSVVSIDTQIEGENFFGQHVVQDAGKGSGVVVSKDGYVVTNNHVLRVSVGFGDSQLVDKVRVTFSDGKVVTAKIIGTDPRSDLAVLKVEAPGLSPIVVGDSSRLEIGQWVIAVGNPLGYENSLSVGVVSNVGRQLPGSSDAVFIDGIQTDAAINPGNSGGALCDADGELVGINSSIATTTRANIGIGFAIPVNRMRQVVDDIIKYGYAKYGDMGIQVLPREGVLRIQEARNELRQRTNASSEPPSQGAVVLAVQPGSPASQAGVHDLDVVTEINGKKIGDFEDYQKIMSPLRPGASVTVKLWSAGKPKTVSLTLADAGKVNL